MVAAANAAVIDLDEEWGDVVDWYDQVKDPVKVRFVSISANHRTDLVHRAAVGAVRAGAHALQPAGHSCAQLGSHGARGGGGGAVAQEGQSGRSNFFDYPPNVEVHYPK